ncbi:phosphoglucosamine mutase [Candidatus Bipolaricaulota bacterium]|nr:phosphoglucosamine mutase [Candidatus Bipolaricaulota bacterium]
MPKYFGTDGVRGVAGRELTCELAFRLGRAAGRAFRPRRALLARDTRLSGPALEAACAAGLAEAGCDVSLAGILPSPAVSHLVRQEQFELGTVISASHNPPEDNGVKFYDPQGLKLSTEEEERVEALLDGRPEGQCLGRVDPWPEAEQRYLSFLLRAVEGLSLSGLKIALDCAHGATAKVAPKVFEALGATLSVIGGELDGTRINATGAAAIAPLQALVLAEGADLGVAFDGDGDRALLVNGQGQVVEGDRLMAALAPELHRLGELPSRAVVFTVLANMGAERYLKERGFRVVRVPVGDRHVSWAMRKEGIQLGGEPSGHIVFGRFSPTGDGILTALLTLHALQKLEKDLATLTAPVPVYPQVRVDVPVVDRKRALEDPEVRQAIEEAKAMLGKAGRLVVRPSGTQPLIRILAEGEEKERLHQAVEAIERALEKSGFRSSTQ